MGPGGSNQESQQSHTPLPGPGSGPATWYALTDLFLSLYTHRGTGQAAPAYYCLIHLEMGWPLGTNEGIMWPLVPWHMHLNTKATPQSAVGHVQCTLSTISHSMARLAVCFRGIKLLCQVKLLPSEVFCLCIIYINHVRGNSILSKSTQPVLIFDTPYTFFFLFYYWWLLRLQHLTEGNKTTFEHT